MNEPTPRKFTHEATTPAVLLFLRDGKVQKAVVYGPAETMVYVREEGRGGFGIIPTQTATDFLAFDDLLTLEPDADAEDRSADEPDCPPHPTHPGTIVLQIRAEATHDAGDISSVVRPSDSSPGKSYERN